MDINYVTHTFTQLPGNTLHQRDHTFICVIVARDHPHNLQGLHQRRDRLQDHSKICSRGQILRQTMVTEEKVKVRKEKCKSE